MLNNPEFGEIEIDVSEELLYHLIQRIEDFLTDVLKPCSFNIWEERREFITTVEQLSCLLGECVLNDLIVEVIEKGIEIYEIEHGEIIDEKD